MLPYENYCQPGELELSVPQPLSFLPDHYLLDRPGSDGASLLRRHDIFGVSRVQGPKQCPLPPLRKALRQVRWRQSL